MRHCHRIITWRRLYETNMRMICNFSRMVKIILP